MKAIDKEHAAVVDEYCDLKREFDLMKPKADRMDVLARTIRGWHESSPADQGAIEPGNRWDLMVGAKAKQRRIIAMGKLFARLGKALFLQACSFPLTMFDKLVPAEDHGTYVIEEQTGSRSLKPVAKVAEMPAPAKLAEKLSRKLNKAA